MTDEQKERLAYLDSKTQWTNEEMAELRRLKGGFVDMGNARDIGVKDFKVSFDNFEVLAKQHKAAQEEGFYIEAISALVYGAETILKMWFHKKTRRIWHADERQTFGELIAEVEKSKLLEVNLIKRLQVFNKSRNLAIHNLLDGRQTYASLASVVANDPSLVRDLQRWAYEDIKATINQDD